MGHSSLATYVSHSPNHSGRRNHKVDTLTPHYMAGNCSIETCAAIFKPTSRKASSNYGIGSDGRIGVYVEEENRAWTSASSANDNRAITFECANLADGSLTDKCWNSLVRLCADICRRYGYKGLYYCGAADYTRLPSGYMLLTMHKWFADTDCPGPWLSKQFARLANEVNAMVSGKKADTKAVTETKSTKLAKGYHKDPSFAGTYRCTVDGLRVRRSPSLSGKEVAQYSSGERVNLDGYWWKSGGYIWGTYIGGSGNRNYVAVGRATGKPEDDDYLVKL